MPIGSLFAPRRRAEQARLAHALRDVPLFREVPQDDLIAIWDRFSAIAAPAGSVLCRRGDPGDRFYMVQAGSLEVRLGLGPSGVAVRRAGPGDFVGEMALLTGAPRNADVVVSEEAVLWVLERGDFAALVARSRPLLEALNRMLCERVTEMMALLEAREAGGGPGSPGRRFGPYRVVEQIGAGGMAAVYSARHEGSEALVALKVLPVGWGAATDFRARLEREAATLQGIAHPNVIKVLAVGTIEAGLGGGCYMVMEWLPQALDRILRAQYPEPLAPGTALHIAAGIAHGLAHAHAHGLVHRDVKPSNVLLRLDGTPVLTDFGLVLVLADMAAHQRLTATHVVVGTADYLAPEQAAGLPVDGRADLYALGVTLYELLAGHVPFAGRTPLETVQAHVELPPPPLPLAVPAAARLIVERALQKRPEDRYPSATAMAAAIQEALLTV
ncbi:MAG: protein kinase domain-containing protein [Chloroflexota bacterium]